MSGEFFTTFFGYFANGLGILVIKAALPSGAIAAVISNRYGCNGKLAAPIVIGTCLICLVTLLLTLMLTPGM
jgi:predicted permease